MITKKELGLVTALLFGLIGAAGFENYAQKINSPPVQVQDVRRINSQLVSLATQDDAPQETINRLLDEKRAIMNTPTYVAVVADYDQELNRRRNIGYICSAVAALGLAGSFALMRKGHMEEDARDAAESAVQAHSY